MTGYNVEPVVASETAVADAITRYYSVAKKETVAAAAAIPGSTPMGTGILDVATLLNRATQPPCTENCAPPTVELSNKVELRGLSNGAEDAVFSFRAEAGKTLSFMTYNGTGNVSMYVAAGRVPTPTDRDGFSTRANSNTETVRFTAPVAGTYYVRLTGTYAGMTLVARQ